MKQFLFNLAWVMGFLLGCTAQPPTKQMFEPASTSNCNLPDTKWLKVVNGYDSKTVVDLATKLEAAAKADAEKIKTIGSASASGAFTSDFSKIVNANSQQTVEVSQEFYEGYRSKRDALCTLYSLLDRPNISAETRAAAEKQFLEINESWSKIKDNEQKNFNPVISGFFVDSVSWKGGRLLFSIHNQNDFDLPLLVDLMVVSLDLDYEIQNTGARPIMLSGTQRTRLKDVFINVSDKETLLTDEQYTVPPNAQIPFKVNYVTTLKSLNDLVIERLLNAGHRPVAGSNVLIKKINYNLEIKFLNPQKNAPEALKVSFVKDDIKNLKFTLNP